MDELLRIPDESDAIDRLRALRAEHARQALRARHVAIVREAHAARLRRLLANATPQTLEGLETSIVAVHFPTVRAVALERHADWEAHLAALERALETDLQTPVLY